MVTLSVHSYPLVPSVAGAAGGVSSKGREGDDRTKKERDGGEGMDVDGGTGTNQNGDEESDGTCPSLSLYIVLHCISDSSYCSDISTSATLCPFPSVNSRQ